jgi:hypothetical protein
VQVFLWRTPTKVGIVETQPFSVEIPLRRQTMVSQGSLERLELFDQFRADADILVRQLQASALGYGRRRSMVLLAEGRAEFRHQSQHVGRLVLGRWQLRARRRANRFPCRLSDGIKCPSARARAICQSRRARGVRPAYRRARP